MASEKGLRREETRGRGEGTVTRIGVDGLLGSRNGLRIGVVPGSGEVGGSGEVSREATDDGAGTGSTILVCSITRHSITFAKA